MLWAGPNTLRRWTATGATVPKAPMDRMAAKVGGVVVRHTLTGGRRTIDANVARDTRARGWARIPRAGCCDFCAMLATRGPVYKEDTALRARDGSRYHDTCRCVSEPVYGAWVPSRQVAQLREIYNSSTSDMEGPDEKRAAFRAALDEARRSPVTQTGGGGGIGGGDPPTVGAAQADAPRPRRVGNDNDQPSEFWAPRSASGRVVDPAGLLSAAERQTADLLAREGHQIVARPPVNQRGRRTSDVFVNGHPVEFKTPAPPSRNHATDVTVRNEVNRAKGQSGSVVIDAGHSDLTEADAEKGIRRAVGAYPDKVTSIRVIGRGYDLIWEK